MVTILLCVYWDDVYCVHLKGQQVSQTIFSYIAIIVGIIQSHVII